MNATKDCLVTISDASFSIATEVLLYSFRKYNPEFDGDVVVITDDLPEDHRERIGRHGAVRFEAPDPRLRAAVEDLQGKEPRLRGIYRRLFSLEVFRLSAYRRLVYVDSDIYCSGDISELFTRPETLLACPDGFTYEDRVMAMMTEDAPSAPAERYGRSFKSSFNAGVLGIGESLTGEETYRALLGMLDHATWRRMGPSKFTDQMVLNLYFEGRFTALPARFNYMVFLEEYQKCLDRVSLLDARLVHFAGAIKPWNRYDPIDLARRAPQFIKFIDVWRELLEEARSGVGPGGAPAAVAERCRRQADW
ncbi:MAG: hypothetical protein LJE70_20160, partial [Chromatiaceae bacterium]|nr:hypothetical protein [Chromatiaceae bacterium]